MKASVTCAWEDSREGRHHSRTLQRSQTQADTRKDTPKLHMSESVLGMWPGLLLQIHVAVGFCFAIF